MTPLPVTLKLLLGVLVVAAGICDVAWRRIPNWLTVSGFVSGLALNIAMGEGGAPGWRDSIAGAAAAFGIYFLLYLLAGRGAGDVKLMTAVGAIIGWRNWLVIFILSSILGGVIALVVVLIKGRLTQTVRNLALIVWEIAHLRSPASRYPELHFRHPGARTLPHGAVVALACLFWLGGGLALAD